MRILVTGGAGFIGARAVAQLVERGHEVGLLLRPATATARIDALLPRVRTWTAESLPDAAAAASKAFAPECCLHFAWYAEPGKYLESERNFDSLADTIALMRGLTAAGCRRFVMSGTCAEYVPAETPLREDGPVAATTLYAAAKLAALTLGEQYARLNGLTLAWGRIFLLYGPGEDVRRAIPAVIRTLRAGETFSATAGTQVRDFLHVDDVAAGFVTLCEAGRGGIYNVSSGVGHSMREIFEMVQSHLGLADRIRFGAVAPRGWEPQSLVGDNTKLAALGWRPRHTLEAGIDGVIAAG